jgi:hypothetical protein
LLVRHHYCLLPWKFLYKFVKLPFFVIIFEPNIILNSVLLIISHETNQTRCHRFNKWFLKGLSNKQELENFTIVTTENQTNGKGQMGSVWTEVGKNLIMSVFYKDCLLDVNQILTQYWYCACDCASLEVFNIPSLMIKWPNDIMSYNFKIMAF